MARKTGKSKSGRASRNSGGGFPSWGIYALGGLAIAGIIYGLSKYGPTSETINGWIDSASGYFGDEDEADELTDSDLSEEEDESATAGTGGYGSKL